MKIIFRFFFGAAIKFPKAFLISLGLIVGVTFFSAALPFGVRLFLAGVVSNFDRWNLIFGLAGFAAYLIVRTLINIGWYVSLDHFGGKYIENVTLRCLKSIASTSKSNLDKLQPDTIKHILYEDVLEVFRVIGHHIPAMFGGIIVVMALFALSLSENNSLGLFLMAALLIGFALSHLSRKMIAKAGGETNRTLKKLHARHDQFVDSILLAQTNNVSPYFRDQASAAIRGFVHTAKKADRIIYWWTGLVQNYNALIIIALSTILAIPSFNGSLVTLAYFTLLAGMIMTEGQKIEQLFQQIAKAQASFGNVDRLLNLPARQKSNRLDFIQQISFNRVAFSYSGVEKIVFEGASCVINEGDIVRLEGANGSGKSTFVKLLMGLYPPVQGEVLINKRSVNGYSQEDLNRRILAIHQDEILLNESIKDYLSIMMEDGITYDELNRFFYTVGLEHEDQPIENGGLSLSAEQRKKILLMKLLLRYKEADVVILDELGSGLDEESKKKTTELLLQMFQKKNKIWIIIEQDAIPSLPFNKILRIENRKLILVETQR